jgi:hypothetical protein
MAWQKAKIKIPDDLLPKEREELAFAILEHIRERTKAGTGIRENGRTYNFPGYSKSYQNSLDFKIAGKSSDVDLTLSGDMLDAMDLLSHKKGEILIGFENGSEDNGKAEGNQLGSYGGSPNARKARRFLGVNKSELAEILRGFKDG